MFLYFAILLASLWLAMNMDELDPQNKRSTLLCLLGAALQEKLKGHPLRKANALCDYACSLCQLPYTNSPSRKPGDGYRTESAVTQS